MRRGWEIWWRCHIPENGFQLFLSHFPFQPPTLPTLSLNFPSLFQTHTHSRNSERYWDSWKNYTRYNHIHTNAHSGEELLAFIHMCVLCYPLLCVFLPYRTQTLTSSPQNKVKKEEKKKTTYPSGPVQYLRRNAETVPHTNRKLKLIIQTTHNSIILTKRRNHLLHAYSVKGR